MNEIEKECWECKTCDDLAQHQTICIPLKQAIVEALTRDPVKIKGNLSAIPPLPISEMYLGKAMAENRRKLKA